MGGLLGVWNFNGPPVERVLLEVMAEPIKHRGPDGIGYHISENVGMTNFHFWTTPESVGESLPLVDESENFCLSFHGRVDNRGEMIERLIAKGATFRFQTDAEIILRAYQIWGKQCPEQIVGEFAFVIWDKQQQLIFCARDISGWKPLYYYRDRDKFIWASEFPPFFRVQNVPKEANQGRVADYLTGSMSSRDETLYRGIFRLPPAHWMVVTSENLQLEKYWGLDSIQDIRYRTDEDYAQHFLKLFQQAIKSQLRIHGKIGADLSGGLDSSSVVSVINLMLKESGRNFDVFSMIFPGKEYDEIEYIQDVVRKWDLKSHLVDARHSRAINEHEQARRYQYLPNRPNGTMGDPHYRLAHSMGFRTLLTGIGGDEWFTGSRYVYADLLKALNFIEAFQQLRWEFQNSDNGLGIIWDSLVRRGILPLIPRFVKQSLRHFFPHSSTIPSWIDPQFAQRVNITQRKPLNPFSDIGVHPYSRTRLYQISTGNWAVVLSEMEERYASRFNIEMRHPFWYRPLVEFGLGIPEDQRRRSGLSKYVLRHALKGVLPEKVRQRHSKAEFSDIVPPRLESLGGIKNYESLKIEQMGWVDSKPLLSQYRHMLSYWKSNNPAYMNLAWELWTVIGIELWYQECLDNR